MWKNDAKKLGRMWDLNPEHFQAILTPYHYANGIHGNLRSSALLLEVNSYSCWSASNPTDSRSASHFVLLIAFMVKTYSDIVSSIFCTADRHFTAIVGWGIGVIICVWQRSRGLTPRPISIIPHFWIRHFTFRIPLFTQYPVNSHTVIPAVPRREIPVVSHSVRLE